MLILNNENEIKENTIATIGFFDGVHLGHRFLLDDLKREAAKRSCKTLIITFSNHPILLFKPNCGLKFLTSCDEKLLLLEREGIDYCLLLPFTHQLASLKSSDFIELLHRKYGVSGLIVGYDHHFGSDLDSTFDDYVRFGKEFCVDVLRCEAFSVKQVNVSSSKIRQSLQTGDIDTANTLLGYRYKVSGRVVHGHQVGRLIGFPTANLQVASHKLMPASGVYTALTKIHNIEHHALMNIGYRPTLNNGGISYEVYIDGFDGDLYDEELHLEMVKFIRAERKFDSIQALKEQIAADLQTIRQH
ncbi:MAG: bifunctional riboflavin kinase/FAD synthetase [Prevotellaceae bacterium]|nr:bifunctional riboflavin kinase/FAD synthetase [Candidatus Minthenecus merdequi]MBQ0088545.1 bifunctional riboflavin kinase/FAD synthetase [Candidatus Faecinaster equi]